MGHFSTLILLVVLYSLGILSTLYGSSLPGWGKLIVLMIAFMLSLLAYYYTFYRPLISLKDRHLKIIFDHLFIVLDQKYREQQPGNYNLRINVMRLRRRFCSIRKRYLRIDFYHGPCSDAEKEQEYLVNVGCCGTAIYENCPVVFDARQKQEPFKGMTATQRKVTEHVNSILSTPIYRVGEGSERSPIGVLNFDSRQNISITGFDKEPIKSLAASYSRIIGPILA